MNGSKSENKEFKEFKLINWKSIIIGSIITLIGYGIYNGSYVYYLYYYSGNSEIDSVILFLIMMLLIVIAGFTVAFLNKPNYKAGIINVLFATIIGIFISNLLIGLLVIFSGQQDIITCILSITVYPIEMTISYGIPVG